MLEYRDSRQVEIIKKGVSRWNSWRQENSEINPKLEFINLSGAKLRKINLSNARLNGCNFEEAKLGSADLQDSELRMSNLAKSNLIKTNLSGADLSLCIMREANLKWARMTKTCLFKAMSSNAIYDGADLSDADLREAILDGAKFRNSNLTGALLQGAYLQRADLFRAKLRDASLSHACLIGADLTGADLRGADLTGASLIKTNLEGADLEGCKVYGVAAWDLRLTGAKQSNLDIALQGGEIVTVDNIEIAQFINLMLDNEKIRYIIDAITTKVVLILGRFTPERKAILDSLRKRLREHNYVPVLFDFEKSRSRDLTETISTLAHMSRFIIADITDAKSIPQELQVIVPNLLSVPVKPLLLSSHGEYSMFEHFKRYPQVLEVSHYDHEASLIAAITTEIIGPAEEKAKELQQCKLRI